MLAANDEFYESLRAVIASIQKLFGKNFQKIIVYDLGGISSNKNQVIINIINKKLKLNINFRFQSY